VTAVAYRIETSRLVLRCWEPDDAPLMKDAVDSSIDHLLPWMPWARYEPQSLDEKLQLAREFRGQFDLGEQYVYGIFEPDESRALGGCGLHPRGGDGSLEIGYWIRADATGRGYATESAAALTRVAFEVADVDRVEIRCAPANLASAAIPQKLGYALVESGEDLIFAIAKGDFPGSPSAATPLAAYDVVGAALVDGLG